MFGFDGIVLRKLRRDDLSNLLDLKNESWLTTHHITIATMEDQVRWFESLDKDVHTPKNLILVAESAKFGKPVGVYKITDIDWSNRNCAAAWDIYKHFRNQKLGKPLVITGTAFCFQVLNMWRVGCEILEENIPSQKCAEAAGFKLEGLKRQSVVKLGKYVNSGVYGVLADEFSALHLQSNQVD